MRRIRVKLAYDGGGFHGWQVQPGLLTIQGVLEEVVSGIEGRPVPVAGSGRTDAGVHAIGQVAAFTLANPIPLPNLRKAINRLLPPAVRVLSTEEVHADFHPRFHAKAKTYEYRIARAEVCSPFEWPYVHHYPYPLREDLMAELARVFEGEHDFTAFAAADPSDAEARSKVRTVWVSVLERHGGRLESFGHPTTTLEDYFLHVVEESKAHPGRRFLPGKDREPPAAPARPAPPPPAGTEAITDKR